MAYVCIHVYTNLEQQEMKRCNEVNRLPGGEMGGSFARHLT